MRRTLATFALLSACHAFAQTPPQFEVVSVKPSLPGRPSGATLNAAHFIGTSLTLRSIIFSVYRVPSWRLKGGPAWIESESFDISATMPPKMPSDEATLSKQADLMVQALLADRFKLKLHRETKDHSTYDLVVAPGGLKLKQSSAGKFAVKMGTGHMEFQHVSMAYLAGFLYCESTFCQSVADRPVIDKTDLNGFFDLTLDWTPDNAPRSSAVTAPSIYTALEEQAGLKLEPRKSPAEFLVIDSVERPAPDQ